MKIYRDGMAGLIGLGALLLLSGCYVSSNKHGDNKDVSIATPFGSMQVKTDQSADTNAIGLTQYPGSTPFKDKDDTNANVNMSFGSFHLGVKAASFQTADGTDKVLAFYRNDLKRYGDVIECRKSQPVGKPDRTAQGLTCDENNGSYPRHIQLGSNLELKTGSPQRQHLVVIDTKDGGTKIGLVSLELPSQLNAHGDKDIE